MTLAPPRCCLLASVLTVTGSDVSRIDRPVNVAGVWTVKYQLVGTDGRARAATATRVDRATSRSSQTPREPPIAPRPSSPARASGRPAPRPPRPSTTRGRRDHRSRGHVRAGISLSPKHHALADHADLDERRVGDLGARPLATWWTEPSARARALGDVHVLSIVDEQRISRWSPRPGRAQPGRSRRRLMGGSYDPRPTPLATNLGPGYATRGT